MKKFNVGDKVRIINYGHMAVWQGKDFDMTPEIIGKEGIICIANGGYQGYAINGIPEKHAWYNEDQLELI